jgi:peptidoglycan/xylan/chitin deacetylase (PgdA/CDA1 family)
VDFERHVRALRRWGYRFVTAGDQARLAAEDRAGGTVSLSFDDGLADNLNVLLPILQRLTVPATVFVVTGWLGGRHPDAPWASTLTPDELRELHGAGVEIGGHTVTHPDLTMLSSADAGRELSQCRQTLERVVGSPVTVAAYPFGRANATTIDACERAGYQAAYCAEGAGSWITPFSLPRHGMTYGGGMIGLRLKRHGAYEPLLRHWPAKALRRSVRRAREVARIVTGDRL